MRFQEYEKHRGRDEHEHRSPAARHPHPRAGATAQAALGLAAICLVAAAGCAGGSGSPQGDPILPAEPLDYQVDLPFYYETNTLLQTPFQTSALHNDNLLDNPLTDEGATLGRVLFYDRDLSSTKEVSCGFPCHVQEFGFSDPDTTSRGVDGRTKRNSMALANARFYRQRTETLPLPVEVDSVGRFFWDERADSLEDQVLMPFEDPVEMGLDEGELVEIVSGKEFYEPLFLATFGDSTVTEERIASALAQFIRSIVSLESRYDEGRRALAARQGEPGSGLEAFPTFTDAENRGKRLFVGPRVNDEGLFMGPCGGCHLSDAQISAPSGAVNNGVIHLQNQEAIDLINFVASRGRFRQRPEGADDDVIYQAAVDRLYAWMDDDPDGELGDLGIAEHFDREVRPPHQIALAIGAFKAPSLRNIAETAPYMHDGSLETLEDVIDHYSGGVLENPHPSINFGFNGVPVQRFGPLRAFEFTAQEKSDLIAFLQTLTDPEVLSAERWSDPFVRDEEADARFLELE